MYVLVYFLQKHDPFWWSEAPTDKLSHFQIPRSALIINTVSDPNVVFILIDTTEPIHYTRRPSHLSTREITLGTSCQGYCAISYFSRARSGLELTMCPLLELVWSEEREPSRLRTLSVLLFHQGHCLRRVGSGVTTSNRTCCSLRVF